MNLTIKQNNQVTEQVTSSIIDKLYNLTKEDVANGITAIATVLSGGLQGRIEAPTAYEDAINYLNTKFGPNLIVSALAYYIRFADPEVISVLTAAGIIPQGGGLTTTQAADSNNPSSFNNALFRDNTDIVSFDEIRYFTKWLTGQSSIDGLFYGATNLVSIDLTNATILSRNLCQGCISLIYFNGRGNTPNTLYLPNLVSLNNYAHFRGCTQLKYVTSLGQLSTIVDDVFRDCTSLESVVLPQNLTRINTEGFYGCTSLSTINLTNVTNLQERDVFNGCSSLEYCDGPNSTQGELNLPNLTGTLGTSVFKGCAKLTSIASLGSITSIGNNAFENCTNLATINFPNTITSVGNNAFNNTAWYNNQPDGGVVISNCLYKYKGSAVGTYTIPSNITSVSGSCFYGQSSLTGITSWPSSLNAIPEACFQNSGLTSFDLTGIVSTGNNAFRGTKLTSIVIPNSVTTLGNDCFSFCADLTSITIGTGVTGLGRNVFSWCTSLETLVLPSNVKSLERDTLQNCTSLQWVQLESTTVVSLNNSSCFNNTNNCEIRVPANLVDSYKAASQWSNLASRIVAIPT